MSEIQPLTDPADVFAQPMAPRRFKTLSPLPISGHVLRIRSMTEREKSNWEAEAISKKGDGTRIEKLKDANRRLFQRCVVNAEGNPYITDAQREKIADWDSADTAFLYEECARHCGIGRGDIEDIVKNCESAPVAG